jgi:hypothetical protein
LAFQFLWLLWHAGWLWLCVGEAAKAILSPPLGIKTIAAVWASNKAALLLLGTDRELDISC